LFIRAGVLSSELSHVNGGAVAPVPADLLNFSMLTKCWALILL